MIEIVILTAAAVLLGGLLYFEKRESTQGRVLTKPLLSALFVAVALTGSRTETGYFGLVLAGLVCGMAGDVSSSSPRRRGPSWPALHRS